MEYLLAFIGVGPVQLLVLALVILLLFGKRIPEMMRGIGGGVREFKEGISEAGGDAEESRS